jgi:hypothetical protein
MGLMVWMARTMLMEMRVSDLSESRCCEWYLWDFWRRCNALGKVRCTCESAVHLAGCSRVRIPRHVEEGRGEGFDGEIRLAARRGAGWRSQTYRWAGL